MKLSAMRRLIWRAVSLVATRKFVRSILRIRFPTASIDEVVSDLQDYSVSATNDTGAMPVCQLLDGVIKGSWVELTRWDVVRMRKAQAQSKSWNT